jgi:hypothetical protein
MKNIIRRAFVTLQIYFDHNGNLIATKRSIAKATIILIGNIFFQIIIKEK